MKVKLLSPALCVPNKNKAVFICPLQHTVLPRGHAWRLEQRQRVPTHTRVRTFGERSLQHAWLCPYGLTSTASFNALIQSRPDDCTAA